MKKGTEIMLWILCPVVIFTFVIVAIQAKELSDLQSDLEKTWFYRKFIE